VKDSFCAQGGAGWLFIVVVMKESKDAVDGLKREWKKNDEELSLS